MSRTATEASPEAPRWHTIEVERDRDGWRAEIPTVDGCEAWGHLKAEAVAACIALFREITTKS